MHLHRALQYGNPAGDLAGSPAKFVELLVGHMVFIQSNPKKNRKKLNDDGYNPSNVQVSEWWSLFGWRAFPWHTTHKAREEGMSGTNKRVDVPACFIIDVKSCKQIWFQIKKIDDKSLINKYIYILYNIYIYLYIYIYYILFILYYIFYYIILYCIIFYFVRLD